MLEEKVCIVTGASRGIGRAIAENFAEQGAKVYALCRNEPKDSFVDRNIQVIKADVRNPQSMKQVVQLAYKESKRLDVFINNAGVLQGSLIGMVTQNQINDTFETNVYGTIYGCQLATRLMARGDGGSIVNISSIMGSNGSTGQAVYGGSKAAVIGITKSLAKELAPQAIRVNAITPGFIDTEMAQSLTPDKFQERLDSVAMGKIGSTRDVANVALFLSSDLSSYVTGQIIGVDGGMLI